MITVMFIIAAMVLLPWIASRILRLDSWVPLPMLQILLGVILGPSAIGQFYPEVFTEIFTAPVRNSLDTLQTFAIVIFAFLAGLELKPKEIIEQEGSGIWIKALQVIMVPIALAAALFWLFFDGNQWQGPDVEPIKYYWAMGVATCITAMPMLVVACKHLGIWGTDISRRLLALVTFDDLILWLTVIVIVALGKTAVASSVFLLLTVILYYAYPHIMQRLGSSSWPTLTVALVLTWAAFSHWAGLHYVLGAFFAGMIIPKSTTDWLGGMAEHQMYWFMPVFFIWTGLKTQWTLDLSTIIFAAVCMWVIAVITKFIGVWLAYKEQGINMVLYKTSLLQNKGLMEIFLVTVLLKANIISHDMFAAVVFMSMISVIAAVPLARRFSKAVTQ